jgi:polo-like kinase 1
MFFKSSFSFIQGLIARRGPLTELNKDSRTVIGSSSIPAIAVKPPATKETGPKDCYLSELHKLLSSVVASNPSTRVTPIMEDEAEDPKVAPMMWVSKWVDYSDKYGFGYSLSDESIGVVFNDLTKLLLLTDGS